MRHLEKLRAVLIEVELHNKPWNMDYWIHDPSDNAGIGDPIACGWASCALGWFARSKEGKALGVDIDLTWHNVTYHGLPTEGADIFDIPSRVAQFLFYPSAYSSLEPKEITPGHVIERINWLLDGKDADSFPGFWL